MGGRLDRFICEIEEMDMCTSKRKQVHAYHIIEWREVSSRRLGLIKSKLVLHLIKLY